MSKTRERYPLSIRKVIKKTMVSTISWIMTVVVLYFFGALASNTYEAPDFMNPLTIGIIALSFLIFLIVYLYQKWYYAVYFYDLTPDYIVIKKGPITPQEITIPYERIQDVYVDQDLLDRIFRLYDVHLSSATISSGIQAHIDGVEKEAADGLRAELLKTVSERISKKQIPQPPPFQQ